MSFKQHLAGHKRKSKAGSLDFQCEHTECGKTFKDRYCLEVHQNLHRNNLQKCFFCPWTENRGRDDKLSTHNDRHLLFQIFECSECGKKFYTKKDRDLHFEGQHEKIANKYSCKLCSFQTHSKIRLRWHVRQNH